MWSLSTQSIIAAEKTEDNETIKRKHKGFSEMPLINYEVGNRKS
jgi:hypothetical protein